VQPLRPEHGVSGNDEPTLQQPMVRRASHTLPSHGMGCALEWLIWAPRVTLAPDSPRAPSRRCLRLLSISDRLFVTLCHSERASPAAIRAVRGTRD
jgi:hypothetical protein